MPVVVDPDASEPILGLLARTPVGYEKEIVRITPAGLRRLVPAGALRLVEAVIDLEGGQGMNREPPRGMVRVQGLWFGGDGEPPRRQPDLWLSGDAHRAWSAMEVAIREELGTAPLLASAYRSPAYQAMLFVGELAAREWRYEETLRLAAPPVRSEHCHPRTHAIDLLTDDDSTTYDGAAFGDTSYYRWLRANARDHGFVESYPEGSVTPEPEPWHWRFVG